ncbi:hypothetical protein H2200_005269 [Cladophialophora chaetospira]|uniref:Uncharacterized protein n=1 Tax=Cladophialophora chaetospira TaxID=386627 RepID=A0AA38XBW0_9EURO|nr:hypothetical protein H2200_005269 [Cladophialophora chaetospira]
MSRLYTRNSKGRQPILGSTTKLSKSSKEHPNDTYQPNGKKGKPVRNFAVAKTAAAKRKRTDTPSSGDSSSTFGGFDSADDASDEDSEEDADDENDLPAVKAPSRSRSMNGAGRKSHAIPDNVSFAGSDSMFGDFDNFFDDDEDPRFSPEENRKRFEEKVFANSDDDNDVYQAVDDISDSDDDMDEHRLQQQELLAILPEVDLSGADFLNQIDGLSAYGFGDDSDASICHIPSSQSGDSATEAVAERHVHFAADADPMLFMRMSESPTITRALLPSALPDTGFVDHGADHRTGGLADDLDDSDLTDDCLPEEAHQSTPRPVETRAPSPPPPPQPSKKSSKKTTRRKGPPRGIFIDDGDKTSGILDPSGKIILMTNPHLLGEEFARRYGASQTSSPDIGFAELIEESDTGDRDSTDLMVRPTPNIMLASLNSIVHGHPAQGQTIGPREAFYPPTTGLYDDHYEGEYEEDYLDLGEGVIDMTDVLRFDSDPDDSDGPPSPTITPDQSFLGKDFSHLNSRNVTAFRRNADPTMSRLPPHLDINLTTSPLNTPAPRRRKRTHSSPYTSSHYKGVTPVQRMRDPNNGRTPDVATPATKKRRLMT